MILVDQIIARLAEVLGRTPQVVFAYLFGSCARGDLGPLSDIDVAVYIDSRLAVFDYRLQLSEILAHELKTDHIDLVILNKAAPLLKSEVVRHGRVIKESKQDRVIFEVQALAEYFDTAYLRQTQRDYLKKQLQQGRVSGQ